MMSATAAPKLGFSVGQVRAPGCGRAAAVGALADDPCLAFARRVVGLVASVEPGGTVLRCLGAWACYRGYPCYLWHRTRLFAVRGR